MGRLKVTKEDLAKGRTFTPGWYKMLITNYEEKQSKNKDNPSTNHVFSVKCLPVGNPEHDEFAGAGFSITFNEQALGKIGPMLKALGAQQDADGGYDVDPAWCKGKQVQIYVKHREYEGKTFNDASDYRPADHEI